MPEQITLDELKRLFPGATRSTILRNLRIGGLAQNAKQQQDTEPKPMATPARARPNPGRRLVRLTSYRLRLLDERNLWDKYFVDALRYAGVIFDDSPEWVKVEVSQVQVTAANLERTEIQIQNL